MKKNRVVVALVMVGLAWGPGYVCAGSSWLDKGIETFNQLNTTGETATKVDTGSSEISDAFKQALQIGTDKVVSQLGTTGGFSGDPAIYIPLPDELETIKTVLSQVGLSQPVDDLELKLNMAAEAATPKAKELFLQAITEMSFTDVKNIYEGADDSATEYFKSKMSPLLEKEMQPIVEQSLSQVGAIQAYDTVMGEYKELPFMPDVQANLEDYVVKKGMDGIFYYIAKEEIAIRTNPAEQTTALLQKVFGGQ